jgi:hypothetical protein
VWSDPLFGGVDVTPNLSGADLLIVDADWPACRIRRDDAGTLRGTARANFQQFVTFTRNGCVERCSVILNWSHRQDVVRNNNGTPADTSDDSLQYSDPANDGSGENELLIGGAPISLGL